MENTTTQEAPTEGKNIGLAGGDTPWTPGPWKVDDGEIVSEEGALIGIIYSTESFPCVDEDDPNYGKIVAELRTNARLVAAAPKLMTSLQGLLKAFVKVSAYPEYKAGEANDEFIDMATAETCARAVIAEVLGTEPANKD